VPDAFSPLDPAAKSTGYKPKIDWIQTVKEDIKMEELVGSKYLKQQLAESLRKI